MATRPRGARGRRGARRRRDEDGGRRSSPSPPRSLRGAEPRRARPGPCSDTPPSGREKAWGGMGRRRRGWGPARPPPQGPPSGAPAPPRPPVLSRRRSIGGHLCWGELSNGTGRPELEPSPAHGGEGAAELKPSTVVARSAGRPCSPRLLPPPTVAYRRSRGSGRALLGSAPLKLRGGAGELRRRPPPFSCARPVRLAIPPHRRPFALLLAGLRRAASSPPFCALCPTGEAHRTTARPMRTPSQPRSPPLPPRRSPAELRRACRAWPWHALTT